MTNVSDKACSENQTHPLSSIIFSGSRAVYNMEKHGRARQATDDNTTRRMRFARWIAKATNTRSKYVILISFPWQQQQIPINEFS